MAKLGYPLSTKIKIIEGFNDYGVDQLGNVWSFKRDIPTRLQVKEMTYTTKTVKLCRNGVYYCRTVPALIATAFKGCSDE